MDEQDSINERLQAIEKCLKQILDLLGNIQAALTPPLPELRINLDPAGAITIASVLPAGAGQPGKAMPSTVSGQPAVFLRHLLECVQLGVERMDWLWGYILFFQWSLSRPSQVIRKRVTLVCSKMRSTVGKVWDKPILGSFSGRFAPILLEQADLGTCDVKQLWQHYEDAQKAFDSGDMVTAQAKAIAAARIDPDNFAVNALLVLTGAANHRLRSTNRRNLPTTPAAYCHQQLLAFNNVWQQMCQHMNAPPPTVPNRPTFGGTRNQMKDAVGIVLERYKALMVLCSKAPPPSPPPAPSTQPHANRKIILDKLNVVCNRQAPEQNRRNAAYYLCVNDATRSLRARVWFKDLSKEEAQNVVIDSLIDLAHAQRSFDTRAHLAQTLEKWAYDKVIIDTYQLSDESGWSARSKAHDLRTLWSARARLIAQWSRDPLEWEIIKELKQSRGWSEEKTRKVLALENIGLTLSMEALQGAGRDFEAPEDEEEDFQSLQDEEEV